MSKQYDSKNYPHTELTEKIIGLLFDVYNELGFGFQEKFYQRALAYKLEDANIRFKREQYKLIQISNRPVGRYYLDFVIDDKVVLELKVANEFFDTYVHQVLGYLKSSQLKVGLLCLITPKGVKIKRLISEHQ